MKTTFISPWLSEKQNQIILFIVLKNKGIGVDKETEASLVILNNIPIMSSFNLYPSVQHDISFYCLLEMEKNTLNPFFYKSENKYLQNIFLRNMAFSVYSDKQIFMDICTSIFKKKFHINL